MADDLWSIRFDLIKEWQDSAGLRCFRPALMQFIPYQEMNVLPLVQRFYLFAGLGGTLGTRVTQSGPKAGGSAGLRLYHCHYDLQPNLPGCLALVAGFGRSSYLTLDFVA